MTWDEFDETYEVFTLDTPEVGARLDLLLSAATGLSRSRISALMESGHAFCGETALKKSAKSTGETVTLFLPPPRELEAVAQNIPLDILYEDDALLVVNKPQGMVVHPAAGNFDNTLVNALLHHCKGSLSGIGGVLRPGIVHRIDKDTSGLLIVAKTDASHLHLSEQIRAHSFARRYLAVLWGTPKQEHGVIETAIGRARTDRKKMAAYPLDTKGAKNAKTEYRVLESFSRFSLVEFTLFTGRTHQIRVHAAQLSHPVVGDALYAPSRDKMGQEGQLLHAAHIGFTHPVTGEWLEFDAPPPHHLRQFLEKHRGHTHEAL